MQSGEVPHYVFRHQLFNPQPPEHPRLEAGVLLGEVPMGRLAVEVELLGRGHRVVGRKSGGRAARGVDEFGSQPDCISRKLIVTHNNTLVGRRFFTIHNRLVKK